MFKCGELHFRKKEVYLTISLITGILLTVILISDYIALLALEMPEQTTQSYTISVLVINWISFVMAILGFIYNCLAKQKNAKQISAVSAAWNMLIFVIRISLELAFIELREEHYAAE